MTGRLGKFNALSYSEKALFLRAWFLLGCYRAAMSLSSFKRLTSGLQRAPVTGLTANVSAEQRQQATAIGYIVAAAAHLTPWPSRCLVQVLVVQRLLARRGIPGQFYLGVHRGCERTEDPTGLSAHAWLQCGDVVVNGEAGCEKFTAVSAFRWGSDCG